VDRPPPPLNNIRSFECAARHLSFTDAAKELGYTQAAISTHVRALEQYIGRPLFHRHPRSLKLTEMGEAFLPTLRQALAQIDRATEALVTTARHRRVILACPMSLAENWMAKRLSGFSEAHPNIEVVVHGTVWQDPSDPIADLTITINREDEVPAGAVKMWNERLALVCSPELGKTVKTPADLEEMPKILTLGRQEYWHILSKALGIGPIDMERGFRSNSSNICLEMAANGLGVTASFASLTKTYLDRGILVEPFDIRPISPWSYYVTATGLGRGGAAERLKDWILEGKP